MPDTPTQQDQESPAGPAPHRGIRRDDGAEDATVTAGDQRWRSRSGNTRRSRATAGRGSSGIKPELFEEDEYTARRVREMLAMYEDTLKEIEEGEIVRARVIRVTDQAVILDVGFKSEGSVPKDEFSDPDELKAGDEVEVFLERLEDDEGRVVLSKKKADFLRVWDKIKKAHEEDDEVPGS
jgi:RecJ-like exonuclease